MFSALVICTSEQYAVTKRERCRTRTNWSMAWARAFAGDEEDGRDANSIDFSYWMSGSGFAEIIGMQVEHRMTLPEWRRHRGDPWWFTRETLRDEIRHAAIAPDAPDSGAP